MDAACAAAIERALLPPGGDASSPSADALPPSRIAAKLEAAIRVTAQPTRYRDGIRGVLFALQRNPPLRSALLSGSCTAAACAAAVLADAVVALVERVVEDDELHTGLPLGVPRRLTSEASWVVLSFLTAGDVLSLGSVSAGSRAVASSSLLWHELAYRDFHPAYGGAVMRSAIREGSTQAALRAALGEPAAAAAGLAASGLQPDPSFLTAPPNLHLDTAAAESCAQLSPSREYTDTGTIHMATVTAATADAAAAPAVTVATAATAVTNGVCTPSYPGLRFKCRQVERLTSLAFLYPDADDDETDAGVVGGVDSSSPATVAVAEVAATAMRSSSEAVVLPRDPSTPVGAAAINSDGGCPSSIAFPLPPSLIPPLQPLSGLTCSPSTHAAVTVSKGACGTSLLPSSSSLLTHRDSFGSLAALNPPASASASRSASAAAVSSISSPPTHAASSITLQRLIAHAPGSLFSAAAGDHGEPDRLRRYDPAATAARRAADAAAVAAAAAAPPPPAPLRRLPSESWPLAYRRLAAEEAEQVRRAAAYVDYGVCGACESRACETRYVNRNSIHVVKIRVCAACSTATVLESSTGDMRRVASLAGGGS